MLEEGEHGWETIVAAQSTSGRFHQASPETEFAVCDLSDEGHLVLCDLDPDLPSFRRHGHRVVGYLTAASNGAVIGPQMPPGTHAVSSRISR
jgi:hypothetical protein